MDRRAESIIAERNRERSKQANFRSLWQETADLIFPRENRITSSTTAGIDKSRDVCDTTAIMDSQDMASGLSSTFIPPGRSFFGLKVRDRELAKNEEVNRYLSEASEITHDELFSSNFLLQLNETLRSLVVFGTGNLFSEWDNSTGRLNFKDFDISLYQILEDAGGNVNTVILTFDRTARQAADAFGTENLGPEILKALEKPETENNAFEFIHRVGPRRDRNVRLSDNLNMPFESVYVDVKGRKIVAEGGFEEFPFAVVRWMKSSYEKYGRGQGTEVLGDVKVLQQIKMDFIECGNKWNHPPLEIEDTFEGTPNMSPDAVNLVRKVGTIQGISPTAMGNFPITREMLEFQQDIIHRAFFRDVFVQLADLKGDRRTTVEIYERIKEGLRRLALPVARLESELFDKVITRSVLLLIRNGRIAPIPPELAGQPFGIEYTGVLALALRSQQAKGFMQFAATVGELAAIFPEATDIIDIDDALPDIARSFGVKTEHLASEAQIAEKRRIRAEQLQAQQLLQAGMAAAEGYGKTNKAPEEGSPAGELINAVKE